VPISVTACEQIADLFIVVPEVFDDDRGRFVETYRREWLPGANEMVQGNRADRSANTVVGLHYHLHQADYWYVVTGTARMVLHDIRQGSPTFGATFAHDLSPEHHHGVYIPPGVAHGFAALTDVTITYLVDQYYNPHDELGLAWNDPAVHADWGVGDPLLSSRDRANPLLRDIPPEALPVWRGRS
jgi:dTDP-4-dehydrorhamnose 3,5-epimerase